MAVRMTEQAANKVERRFNTASREIAGAREELRGFKTELVRGAGEFGHIIEDEARHFTNSWRAVLDVYSDSAAVIAANTNTQFLDLLNIDTAND